MHRLPRCAAQLTPLPLPLTSPLLRSADAVVSRTAVHHTGARFFSFRVQRHGYCTAAPPPPSPPKRRISTAKRKKKKTKADPPSDPSDPSSPKKRRKMKSASPFASIEEMTEAELHGTAPIVPDDDWETIPQEEHDDEPSPVDQQTQQEADSVHSVEEEMYLDAPQCRYPAPPEPLHARVVPEHRLLLPTIDAERSEPATTRLSLNQLSVPQRARLRELLDVSGITTTKGAPWGDFALINHLSTREWSLETDRFNFHGKTVAERVVTEEILKHTLERSLQWVQHCAPITFEVSKASPFAESPNLGGKAGMMNDYDRATAVEPEVSSVLSYTHVKQMEAVFLNAGNLTLLSTQLGLHGLMNADALSSLADFTPAERQNPALLVQGKKLGNPEVSLHNTNLTRLSNNIVGAKVLALIGAVRLEKGAAASKDLARHVLFGSHASEEILQGKGGIDSNDVVELAVASLDEQVLKTSPNKVLANLLVHMNIQVEWKTEVIELRNSADEKRELESLVDTADRITDSVHESIEKIRTTGKEVASMQSALDEAKKARQERLDRPAPEKVAPEPTGHEAITDAAPRKEDGTALAPVTEEQSSSVVELDDDDDYTLQFDAHGAPIDIRQTSLKYPIEPGPHQSDTPLSAAPMYSVPKAEAPLVERLHWKNRMKLEKERTKLQMEGVFEAIMRPRKLFYKTAMVDKRTGQTLGYGKSRSVATSRVEAQLDAVKRVRANLLSLRQTSHDVQAASSA